MMQLDDSDVLAKWPNLGLELQDTCVRMAQYTQQLSHHLSTQIYWDSSESRRLFGAYEEDQNTLIAINHKIEKLQSSTKQLMVIKMLWKVVIHVIFAHKHRSLKYDNAVPCCAWHTLMHETK